MDPYEIGRSVGRELAEALLTEVSVKKIIAVYAGRFQPAHAGHYSVYQLLVSKFGANNVYIGTSGVTDAKKSPFSFAEKKQIITTMFGVPANKIVQVRNPFAPDEVFKKYDEQTTAYVTAFSEKDAGRLGGKYFKPFTSVTPDKMQGYRDAGYFIVAPELSGISGTQIRTILSDRTTSLMEKKAAFVRIYGRFNQGIFELIIKKLGGTLKEDHMISRAALQQHYIEQWRHRVFKERQLLLCGGAAGHLAHPFEDMNLTFGDLKKLVELGLSGQLNVEAPVTEKLDGQAIAVSYRPDKGVIFARNKSHLKDRGLNAMDVNGVKSMFAGRGELSDAFTFAAQDLASAISSLTQKQQEKIFANGKKFMSMEIIYPATQNVVPYGMNMLIFHNAIEYDDVGNAIGTDSDAGRMLAGMVKQINQNIQKTFTFRGPVVVQLPRAENFSRRKTHYVGRITSLANKFGLRDSDPVIMWHQRWWEEFITATSNRFKYAMPNYVLEGLLKRWAFLDTGGFPVAEMRRTIDHPEFLNWVLTYDKQSQAEQVKKNLQPFELIFLQLGAEILQNARGLISLSPGSGAESLRKDLDSAIKELSSTTDVKKLSRLKDNLQKIEALGTSKLIPSEGIVFVYRGKLFKLTGLFAPLNQVLGLLKY